MAGQRCVYPTLFLNRTFRLLARRVWRSQEICAFSVSYIFTRVKRKWDRKTPWLHLFSQLNPLTYSSYNKITNYFSINPSNTKLNPICHMLALLEARHIFHVSRIRDKNSYIHLPQPPPKYTVIFSSF